MISFGLMSNERKLVILMFVIFVIFFNYAFFAVCQSFYYLPGYDRCLSISLFDKVIFNFIAFLPVLFIPIRRSASSFVLFSVYLMHFYGAIALLPSLGIGFSNPELALCAVFFVVGFYFLCSVDGLKLKKMRSPSIGPTLFILILFLINSMSFILFFKVFGFSLDLPSIYDVYGARTDFKEKISGTSGLVLYVVLWAGYSFAPVSLVSAIHFYNVRPVLSVVLALSSVLLSLSVYSAAAFKSVAFIPIFCVLIYLIFGGRKSFLYYFLIFWVSLIVIAFILYVTGINEAVFIHWFRRVFIVPGMNVAYFLDYYGLFSYGLAKEAPSVIMSVYYDSDGSANSGVIGNGFAMFGLLGVIFNVAIIYLLLIALGFIVDSSSQRVAASVLFPFSYALSNSATTTSLITYGGIITLILLYIGGSAYRKNIK